MAKRVPCARCGAEVFAGAPMKAHRKSRGCVSHGLVLYGPIRPPWKFLPARCYVWRTTRRRVAGRTYRVKPQRHALWFVPEEVKVLVAAVVAVPSQMDWASAERVYPTLHALVRDGMLMRLMWRKARRKGSSYAQAIGSVMRLSSAQNTELCEFLEETLWGVVR